jgi:hypothetical protein
VIKTILSFSSLARAALMRASLICVSRDMLIFACRAIFVKDFISHRRSTYLRALGPTAAARVNIDKEEEECSNLQNSFYFSAELSNLIGIERKKKEEECEQT